MFEVRPLTCLGAHRTAIHIAGTSEVNMKNRKLGLTLLGTICILLARSGYSQEKTAANAVEVHLVITDAKLRQDAELPPLQIIGKSKSHRHSY